MPCRRQPHCSPLVCTEFRTPRRKAMVYATQVLLTGDTQYADSLPKEVSNVEFYTVDKDPRKPLGTFNADQYHAALNTQSYGRLLMSTRSVASTQSLLLENRKLLPHGAFYQDVRRTPSMRVKVLQLDRAPSTVDHACDSTTYSLQESLKDLMESELGITGCSSAFPFRIKWPNDIYVTSGGTQERIKIGGILCNSMGRGQKFNVVIGIGLNVNNEEPTTCINSVLKKTFPHLQDSELLDREAILAAIMNHLEQLQVALETDGFEALEALYRQYWLHEAQHITVGEKQVPMIITGITKCGYLRASDEYGEEFELHPDGNSLDMMRGMIIHKSIKR